MNETITRDFVENETIVAPSDSTRKLGRDILSRYLDESPHGHKKRDIEASDRIATSASLITPMSPHALDAIYLQDLPEQLDNGKRPVRQKLAATALLDYWTDPSIGIKPATYAACLMGDLRHIDAAADTSVMSPLQKSAIGERVLDALSAESDCPVGVDMWQKFRLGADIVQLDETSKMTNIESMLARACRTIDRIQSNDDNDADLLYNISLFDSFYGPALDIYGHNAAEMLGRSISAKARLDKSGNERFITASEDIMKGERQLSRDERFMHMLGAAPVQEEFLAGGEAYGEQISFANAQLDDIAGGRWRGELKSRFKSEGSLAEKLAYNKAYSLSKLPRDLFAALAVLETPKEVGEFANFAFSHMLHDKAVSLQTAASKKAPFYLQGSPDYVASVYAELSDDIRKKIEVKEITQTDSPIFQVIKATTNMGELQCQTFADRDDARLGSTSHLFLSKIHDKDSAFCDLAKPRITSQAEARRVYARKHRLNVSGEMVNGQSIPGGEQIRRDVLRVLY